MRPCIGRVVFGGSREAQPLNNKAHDKHGEGCRDWMPNTPRKAARFSGESTFLGASLRPLQGNNNASDLRKREGPAQSIFNYAGKNVEYEL